MEKEVRWVAGLENCFVSLPLSLLETLESTHPTRQLPPFLPLQLISLSSDDVICHVSWSGSPSSSPAIEISQEFAACIGLPDRTIVRVRALPNLPKASLVTIEPVTEDDWEVVELNAQLAEAAILNQVRIVHGNMTFPLWLHGNRVVTFTVVSMLPDKTAVQLVPGTEVAVAPKRRMKSADHCRNSSFGHLNRAHPFQKVLLRVQDPHNKLIQECNLGGVTMGVELTSIALVHPETANNYMLEPLQVVVIVPRLSSVMKIESSRNQALKKQLSSSGKDLNVKVPTNNERDFPYAIVRLVFSESASKGHLMLCWSLRRYLRVRFHSWLYVQSYFENGKKDDPSFSLSPCQFRILRNSKDPGSNTTDVLDASNNLEDKLSNLTSSLDMNETDFSLPGELVPSVSYVTPDTVDGKTGTPSNIKDRLKGLIHAWIMAQLRAISSMTEVKPTSLVLGPATFLSFKLMAKGSAPHDKQKTTAIETAEDTTLTVQSGNEMLYILCSSGESLLGQKYSAYELEIGGDQFTRYNDDLKLFCENLSLATHVSYNTCADYVFNQTYASTVSSLSWMGTAASDVVNRLTSLLSPDCGTHPLPGHVLIYGPPGSGKTSLSLAASKSLEENKDILAHTVFIGCSAFAIEKESVRQMLCHHLSEALDNAPSIVVFDDLDSIITSSGDTEGSQMSASVVSLASFIAEIMDEYGEKRNNSCSLGPIAFIACVRALDSIPESLTASGRFNFHIQLPAPSASERVAILRHEIQKSSLQCSDDVLLDIASKCDGYDAYDLAILVGRTIHAAICRYLPSHEAAEDQMRPSITADDFLQARQDFLPVSMRDISKAAPDGGYIGWEDVGGLVDVRNAIKEMIELPSKFPTIFAKSPLRLRSNVLLYGPPGCGKTHIVGAAAAASSLRFISIKGPELLNKYIGASEQAVRDVFSKAAAAAPCILFFDEFDSIAPKRGHDNTGVTDRVVNQFLTELDGVEVLTGVFVFAATSRPDLLDAALLRPGRLDRLLFCDFPAVQDRLDILRALSKKLPLSDDVDLEAIAVITDGFSGADLQALLSDAQLAAAQEIIDNGYDGKQGRSPLITGPLLNNVASKAKRSVSDSERQRLYDIYNQFVDSKRSVAAQSRDAKGKRATLA
ncbi:peroxisomal ATPase PEX1 isoform X2 [Silene latifolia]|uniref:peroxisomal ATPase PEX1 isoform X2 n=1 Tax=Silene latifolia TaxID=37657 RepID=UPI003D7832E7